MSLYNFSSVDPEHYNRIKTTIPNHFLSRYVNICVSTFTSNCNIEVLNKNDYIEFEIEGSKHKVFCTDSYSKIDTAILSILFEEWCGKDNIKISLETTTIDTVVFKSEKPFKITDMSYNMKLITGFYCLDETKWPIVSKEREWQERETEPSPIPVQSCGISDIVLRVGDIKQIHIHTVPGNARGYTVNYTNPDEKIVEFDENGYIHGIAVGEVEIAYELRNPGIPEYLPPFKKGTFKAIVKEKTNLEIKSPPNIPDQTMTVGESRMLFVNIEPPEANYTILWHSDNIDIAIVEKGYITALKIGKVDMYYRVSWWSPNERDWKEETRSFTVTVGGETITVKRQLVISDTVGYMLSTPILYLLTNVGSHVFYNDIKNDKNIQCGMVCMCLNNSWSSSFPIIASQGEIVTKCALNTTSDVYFILVDANMREVKLLNPMYITVSIRPDEESLTTPGLLQ